MFAQVEDVLCRRAARVYDEVRMERADFGATDAVTLEARLLDVVAGGDLLRHVGGTAFHAFEGGTRIRHVQRLRRLAFGHAFLQFGFEAGDGLLLRFTCGIRAFQQERRGENGFGLCTTCAGLLKNTLSVPEGAFTGGSFECCRPRPG